jgi:hypothetical protein
MNIVSFLASSTWFGVATTFTIAYGFEHQNAARATGKTSTTKTLDATPAGGISPEIVIDIVTAPISQVKDAEDVLEALESLGLGKEYVQYLGLLRPETDICKLFLGEPNPDLSGVGVIFPQPEQL